MKNHLHIFQWSLFDFANSIYATIIASLVFPVYFKTVVCEDQPIGDFYLSVGINIAMVSSAILNPICGAVSDHASSKKRFLFFFTALSVVFSALLFFAAKGTIFIAVAFFALSNIGFQTGMAFYDAFIPEIAVESEYNRVSGIGYGVGYLGSIAALALTMALKSNPPLLFVACAVGFALFSVPLFLFLPERRFERPRPPEGYARYGIAKVMKTLRGLNRHPDLRNYLIAFFFYIDAVETIIVFASVYATSTLHFSMTELVALFAVVQITAMLGSFVFGAIGERIGLVRSLFINILCWLGITLAVFFTADKTTFFVVGALAGTFLGSTQSVSRALMAKLMPFEMRAELFGFYALMDKTSTIVGPLTFGLVSWLTGSERLAILSMSALFLTGFVLLFRVHERPTTDAPA